jgi:predicted dehydrogenase
VTGDAALGPRRPVRVAVVGLGRMGLVHTALLATIRDVSLVGLADRSRALGRSLRGMGFRAPTFTDLEPLLAAVRPDAVWVCTPPDSHLALTRRALAAGAAVVIEKPLAHTLADGTAIRDLAAQHRLPVACGYTLAFWPSFVAAREAIAAGAIGRVRRGRLTMYLSQIFGKRRGWMYERRRSGGGVVANVSSHLLFVLRWFLGMPVGVTASWKCPHGDVEDEVEALFRFADGAEVGFASSWSVPDHPVAWVSAALEGDAGALTVTSDGLELVAQRETPGWPAGRTMVRDAALPQPAAFYLNADAYWVEDARFLAWATGGAAPPIAASDGLEVQAVMAALYESAAAGGVAVAIRG